MLQFFTLNRANLGNISDKSCKFEKYLNTSLTKLLYMEDIIQNKYIIIHSDKTIKLFNSLRDVSNYLQQNNISISHTTINRRLSDNSHILLDNMLILNFNIT